LIKHIVSSVAQLLERPPRPGQGDEDKLTDKLKWILSFYWVAFDKKKAIYKQWADEACETLAYSGLLFFDYGYLDVMKSCLSDIRSIIELYCKGTEDADDYTLGDLFAHFWSLRILTSRRQSVALTQLIDRELNTKPTALADDQWQQAQRAMELRRNQLEERLFERDFHLDPDSSEALLIRLLRQNVGSQSE